MRRHLFLGLAACLPLCALPSACASSDEGPVALQLVLRAPAGLLSQATTVKLSVFDSSKGKCLPTGHASSIPAGASTFALQNTGCAKGVGWCKEIALDKDGSSKMFAVVASNAAGTLAEGCATATINQDPLEVDIKVQRYLPPACCGNGKLEPGEQCDGNGAAGGDCPGMKADAVCAADCTSVEIPVDRQPTDKLPVVGTKSQLALAFCPGAADNRLQNGLRAVFTDTAAGVAGGSDVAIRAFDQNLYPLKDASLILPEPHPIPLRCTDPKATKGSPNGQDAASITPIGTDLVAVVYISDELTATQHDVFLSAQGLDGCAEAAPLRVSSTSGASSPDVAEGTPGNGLVVWARASQVFGRLIARTTDGSGAATLTPQANAEFSIAPNGTLARVAGSSTGWVVAYQGAGSGDGDGIFVRTVAPGGVVGPEVRVNTATSGVQDQPDVAMLADGRFVVAWRSAGDVWFQRFDKTGTAAAHDQDAPLNTITDGEQARPAVAASGDLGEFYAVAWETAQTGNGAIAARFVGGDAGFGFNSVSGQNDEFEASTPGRTGVRHLPAVAVGGGGYVAIGWQDEAASQPGVAVRRFPLPL